jgi:hypothetical protein
VFGAGIGGAVGDDTVGISFRKVVIDDGRVDVSGDVGEAVGSKMGILIGDPDGVAINKVTGAGVGDGVRVKASRDVGGALIAIGTVRECVGEHVEDPVGDSGEYGGECVGDAVALDVWQDTSTS